MKQVLTLCFTLSFIAAFGQFHCLKLNSTFILNNNPIGGFGYEYSPDSSLYSFGLNTEVGMYSNTTLQTVNTSLDNYALFGVGLMPEFRRYVGGNGWWAPRGFFMSAFTKARYLRQSVQYGVSSIPGGYQFDSPHTTDTFGFAFDYGVAIGFKTGKSTKGIHVEVLAGYALSNSTLYENPGHRQELVRFEISLSGILAKRKDIDPEFTW